MWCYRYSKHQAAIVLYCTVKAFKKVGQCVYSCISNQLTITNDPLAAESVSLTTLCKSGITDTAFSSYFLSFFYLTNFYGVWWNLMDGGEIVLQQSHGINNTAINTWLCVLCIGVSIMDGTLSIHLSHQKLKSMCRKGLRCCSAVLCKLCRLIIEWDTWAQINSSCTRYKSAWPCKTLSPAVICDHTKHNTRLSQPKDYGLQVSNWLRSSAFAHNISPFLALFQEHGLFFAYLCKQDRIAVPVVHWRATFLASNSYLNSLDLTEATPHRYKINGQKRTSIRKSIGILRHLIKQNFKLFQNVWQ